jgi:hypothetical protein
LDVLSRLVFAVGQGVDGVIGIGGFVDVPFEFHEAVIVFGVDDGVFTLCEGDFAEGVAVAYAAI